MKLFRPIQIVLLATLLGVPPAATQDTADPTPADSGVVEQVRVRLVQIALTARDRHGEPVTDLTADEMRVKLRGKHMEVAFLDRLTPEVDDAPLPRTRLKVNAPGGWEGEVNIPDSGPARYFVIFVDLQNDVRLGRPEAMEQTFRFIDEQLAPTDRFAVISYDGELRLEAPFTNDPQTIRIGIELAYSRGTGQYVDLTRRMLNLIEMIELCQTGAASFVADFDEQCLRDTAYEYADQVRPRAKGYINALDGVIRHLGGLEGRKTVLALSHGYAVEPGDDISGATRAIYGNLPAVNSWLMTLTLGEGVRREMDRLIQFAVESGVTLNFIDRNAVPHLDHSARNNSAFQPGGERPVAGAHAAAQADIEEIARNTGGVLVKTLDVYEGLSRAMAIERGAYMLGYYIDEYIPPKKLKKATVSTTRGRVKIGHQRGFYARKPQSDATRSVAGKIALGPAVPLEDDDRGGQFVPFHILAEPRGIGYDLVEDQAVSTFTMHVTLSLADGRELRNSYHLINHAYPRQLWEAAEVAPVVFSGWVELPPGDYVLRTYIRNPARSTEGTVEQPIHVPGV